MTHANSSLPPQSFIESFVEYCDGFPTAHLFKKWAAIACISGVLERRVWAVTRQTQLVPNFIILLVSPPGIGKSRVLVEVHDLWQQVIPKLHVSPLSITRAGFIDHLAECEQKRTVQMPHGKELLTYHSILVAAPEFGVLVPKHDLEFLNTINDLYDCRSSYAERKRSLEETISIQNPHVTIVAGTQPAYLGALLPDTAYGMGFTSRCIMVYQGAAEPVPIFGQGSNPKLALKAKLVGHLNKLAELNGQVKWTEEVQFALQEFVTQGMPPTPDHFRLTNYNTRRDLHLLKLCMISAASRLSMEIHYQDFIWAKEVMLEAEAHMPDIFKDMMAGPDTQIIGDLANHAKYLCAKEGKPISQSRLVHFLSSRIPSNRVMDIIAVTVRSGYLDEHASSTGMKSYTIPKAAPTSLI